MKPAKPAKVEEIFKHFKTEKFGDYSLCRNIELQMVIWSRQN